jgi:hypothetical protein
MLLAERTPEENIGDSKPIKFFLTWKLSISDTVYELHRCCVTENGKFINQLERVV